MNVNYGLFPPLDPAIIEGALTDFAIHDSPGDAKINTQGSTNIERRYEPKGKLKGITCWRWTLYISQWRSLRRELSLCRGPSDSYGVL